MQFMPMHSQLALTKYPSFLSPQESSPVESEHHKHRPRVPEEKFGLRFLVSCKNLSFKLKVERNGSIDHVSGCSC